MNNPIGLYIHIPFCKGKCPYCDFYSLPADEEKMDFYCEAVLRVIRESPAYAVDTIYFGGGTPSLLGAKRLNLLLEAIFRHFSVAAGAEITVEINPGDDLSRFFPAVRAAGVNRLSIGMQSGVDAELRHLGRRHTVLETTQTVRQAQKAGLRNLSLDLMLATTGQTQRVLAESLALCERLEPTHLSAYLLKVEPGTPYAIKEKELCLPEEEEAAQLYLYACRELEKMGFSQYEISNFAIPGYECRHNLKYWHTEPYLGIGPAAHSFLDGKRFYYPRNIDEFLGGIPPTPDGIGGDFEEYAMLALRLREGLRRKACAQRYGAVGEARFKTMQKIAVHYPTLVIVSPNAIYLTLEGFLLSNSVIAALLS